MTTGAGDGMPFAPPAAPAVTGQYVAVQPRPALRRYVRRFLGYREYSPLPLRRRQPPAGSCALILGFGSPLRLDGPAGRSTPCSFLAGPHDGAVVTEFAGDQQGVQVDLSPLGVFVLLRRPTAELTNGVPDLGALGDPELEALPGRLAEDPDWPARFARLDHFLTRRLLDDRVRRPDPEVALAWSRLVQGRGAVSVAELVTETGWSRRHLLTRFRSQVGLAPKQAARVLRFERAAALVASGQALAEVAAGCGYADQSHLTREFRALAGVTPARYRTELGP